MPRRSSIGSRVAGIDGCRRGWVVTFAKVASGLSERIELCPTFEDAMTVTADVAVIAVDMPIGLLDDPRPGGRPCDVEARRRLPGRTSSVFSPPPRRVLEARLFEEARGHGMTIQSFHLLPKIREIDAWIDPDRQLRVREAHPEL